MISATRGGIRAIPQPERKRVLRGGAWPLADTGACYRALALVAEHPELVTPEVVDHLRYWSVRMGGEIGNTHLIETAYRILRGIRPEPCGRYRASHKSKDKLCVTCQAPRADHVDVQSARLLRIRRRLVEA